MKNTMMMAGAIALTLAGTGCATKKYVTQTLSPVESRVTATEAKNGEQDKQLASQGKEIEEISTDLSRTKERLSADISAADAKATAAGQSAQQAGQRADSAQQSADGAKNLAQQGIDRGNQIERTLTRTMDAMNKYQKTKEVTVLFPVNQSKLDDEGKAQLDDIAKSADGLERYVIEVQGFTDKTGSATYNERLSQERAASVSRYLANEHKIPVRAINQLGSGYALPVADDKTRDGRKQNRRVEIRLYVPEAGADGKSVTAQAGN